VQQFNGFTLALISSFTHYLPTISKLQLYYIPYKKTYLYIFGTKHLFLKLLFPISFKVFVRWCRKSISSIIRNRIARIRIHLCAYYCRLCYLCYL